MSLHKKYGPWALIAGASEGIGLSFAQHLANEGFNLFLLARRGDVLEQNAKTLNNPNGVEIKTARIDLTSPELHANIADLTAGLEVGLLIYNAGAMHGAALFHDMTLEKSQKLIDLNCRGPVTLCHHFGEAMRQRKKGGVILLSSLMAFAGGSYCATYCATKSFDIILAQSLWHEMAPFNVDVLALVAGATDTPAMVDSGVNFENHSSPPMHSDDVVKEALSQIGKGPLHIAGQTNRDIKTMFKDLDEASMIEAMSMGAANLYDKPYIPVKLNGDD